MSLSYCFKCFLKTVKLMIVNLNFIGCTCVVHKRCHLNVVTKCPKKKDEVSCISVKNYKII